MIEHLIQPFILELKRILPPNSWEWVIPSLRRDALVWESIAFYQKTFSVSQLDELVQKPEDCSPANFALRALHYPRTPEELRSLPLIPVEPSFASLVDEVEGKPVNTLQAAGLSALHLRQKRYSTGSWDDWANLLQASSPTALSCLFGIIPDQLEFLQALLPENHPEAHISGSQSDPYHLLLHILLSNPSPPSVQAEFIKVILRKLSPAQQNALKDRLSLEPTLAAQFKITPKGISPSNTDSPDSPSPAAIPLLIQVSPLSMSNLVDSKPQSDDEFPLLPLKVSIFEEQSATRWHDLEATIEKTYDVQAMMLAKMAIISLLKGDVASSLARWNQARNLRPNSITLTACYIFSLFHETNYPASFPESTEILHHLADKPSAILEFLTALTRQQSPIPIRLADHPSDIQSLANQAVEEILSLESQDTFARDAEIFLYLLTEVAAITTQIHSWSAAEKAASKIVKLLPDHLPSLFLLAYILHSHGKHNAALNLIHLMECFHPSHPNLSLFLAQSCAANHLWKNAALYWQKVQLSSSDQFSSCIPDLELAASSILCGDFPLAQQICRHRFENASDDGVTLAMLADASQDLPPQDRLDIYAQAIELAPDHPYPWLAKSRFLMSIGAEEDALTTIKAAAQTIPSSPEIQAALGELLLHQGKPSHALPHLESAAAALENTLHSSLSFSPADILAVPQSIPAFLSQLQLRFSMDWTSPFYTYDQLASHLTVLLGKTLLKLGHHLKAQRILERFTLLYHANPELSYQLACVYQSQGEYAKAGHLIKNNVLPFNPPVEAILDFVECANHADGLASTEEIIEALQKAIEIAPHHFEALVLLAETLTSAQEHQPAIELYEQILQFPQANEEHWKERIRLHLSQAAIGAEKYELALATLLECDPQNPLVLQQQAVTYLKLGLPEEALKCAQKTLEIQRQDADLLAWYASFLNELAVHSKEEYSLRQNALEALETAVQIMPLRSDLRLALAETYELVGDRANAISTLQFFVSSSSAEPVSQITVDEYLSAAQKLLRLGELQNARIIYQTALELLSASTDAETSRLLDILTTLSSIHRQQGDVNEALSALQGALQLSPGHPSLTLDIVEIILSQAATLPALKEQPEKIDYLCQLVSTALENYPDNFDLNLTSAFLSRLKGNRDRAIYTFQSLLQVIENQPPSQSPLPSQDAYLALIYSNLYQLYRVDLAEDLANHFLEEGMEKIHLQSALDQGIGFELICESIEHNLNINPPSLQQFERLLEISPDNIRLQALAVQMKRAQGDFNTAGLLFENALLSKNPLPTHRQCEVFSPAVAMLSSWFTEISALHSLARSAQDLGLWDLSIELINNVLKVTPTEPLPHYDRMRMLVMRGEYQQICQRLEIKHHAPSASALRQESASMFQASLAALKESIPNLPADSENLANLTPQWEMRARWLFSPHSITPQDLQQPANDMAVTALQILHAEMASTSSTLSITAFPYANSPFIQFHLALRFMDSQPDRALEIVNGILAWDQEAENLFDQPKDTWLVQPRLLTCLLLALKARLIYKLLTATPGKADQEAAEGMNALSQALEIMPDEPRWYVLAARLAVASPHQPFALQKAIQLLEKALQLEPDCASHYVEIAQLYLRDQQPGMAIQSLEQALQLDQDNPSILRQMAIAYQQARQWEEAARFADAAIEKQPLDQESILLRGEIALDMGDAETALQFAERALEQPTDNPIVWSLLAKSLHLAGKTDDALRIYEQAIPIKEEFVSLHLERLTLVRQKKGLDAFLNEAQVLLQELPTAIPLHAAYASALVEKDRPDEAITSAQIALRLCHQSETVTPADHALCHGLLGNLLSAKGQLDQAIYHLTEAVQLDPRNGQNYRILGDVYASRGDADRALSCYLQAIKSSPEDAYSCFKAGILYKEAKDFSNAEQMLRQAARVEPDNLAIQRQLGAVVALNLLHNRKQPEISQP
jgi:tetratricopeptide (TPR) repeat protein